MKPRSLSHVGLTVVDFEKAVKWYWEMFKFPLIAEQEMSSEEVSELYSLYNLKDTSLKLGFLKAPKGGVIEIFQFTPSLPPERVCWNRIGPTHLTIDVRNVKKWYKKLSEKGVKFLCQPQKTDGNEWVFLEDPDGNMIELIDLKFNYYAIRYLGWLAGPVIRRLQFMHYYK